MKNDFNIYFLNQDISLNNISRTMRMLTLIENIQIEVTVSQICYIGPRFCFMICRK